MRCNVPGCREPSVGGPRCREHERARRREAERLRPTPSQRGYDYAWAAKIRPAILRRDDFQCTEPGCPNVATQVDHIVPKSQGGTDDEANLRSVCRPCHDRKSGKERHL
jgi:5-methylcytosine-specific restriction protein A